MKHKFSSMGRVAIALVLALSLSLVMAVPAVALTQPTVSITAGTDEISQAGTYTIGFRITDQLDQGETITVRFPDDTDVTDAAVAAADVDFTSGIGFDAGTGNTVTVVKTPADRTVAITLTDITTVSIGALAYVQVVITGVTNPTGVGDYTLEVKTTAETTWVESDSYSIEEPVIGGTVYVYNPSDVLMETFTGENALDQDQAGAYYDDANYTIEVGPGTYLVSDGKEMQITGDGVTIKSTDGAASTIIKGSSLTSGGPILQIWNGADNVTVEDLTFSLSTGSGIWITYNTTGNTVQNNIISAAAKIGIVLMYDGGTDILKPQVVDKATVSGNVITGCTGGISLEGGCTDCTISGNTITSCTDATKAGIALQGGFLDDSVLSPVTLRNTITGNTCTDGLGAGITLEAHWRGGDTFDDNVIEGNTISGNEGNGIQIDSLLTITGLVITGNDIIDNDGVGIVVGSWTAASDAIKFNNITDNDTTDGYSLENAVDAVVDATHNWWGTADEDDVAAMIYNSGTGTCDTTYDPFLSDTVDAVFSATAVDTGTNSLDAETEVGVVVAGTGYATKHVVSAAKYIANPGAPLDNALAYYDVYVTGISADSSNDTVMLKFYAEDADDYADASLHAWSSNTATWVDVSPAAEFSEFGGFLYVTLNDGSGDNPSTPTIGDLTELPFAVCGEEAVEEDILAYYKGLTGDAEVVDTTDLLTAANDWADEVVPPGFTEAISTTQLLALANEWAATE